MVRVESSALSTSRLSVVDDDDESMDREAVPHLLTSMASGPHLNQVSPLPTHLNPDFSPSAALLALRQSQPQPRSSLRTATSLPPTPYTFSSHSSPHIERPLSTSHLQSSSSHPYANFSHQEFSELQSLPLAKLEWSGKGRPIDPFKHLRNHNIGTKAAWTVIPASEGARVLDLCKSMSKAASAAEGKLPCYNRETLFDEEWQAHMKDIHGVFLIWPETWVRRIEVLDLDAFGGDIVAVNEVIMDS